MSNNYIVIYNRKETDFTHYGLGVIQTTLDSGVRIFERLNAEYTCEFTVPYTDECVQYLVEDNIVKITGQLFVIRTTDDSRDQEGKLLCNVFAEHISTELLTEYIPNLQYTNATANAILSGILAETRFEGNATAITTNHDFSVERRSAAWGLNHFIALTSGEMKRDNFNITFRPQIGQDIGVRISYRKNLKSIVRTKDSRNVITRLYVYGKDGIALPNPINSPNINLYPRPKCGEVTFEDIDDLAVLQVKGAAYLSTVDTPMLSYEADVIELKDAEGYDESEAFNIGDTVWIDDEDLSISVKSRIVEYERYPDDANRSRVVLSNFKPSIMDTLSRVNETVRTVDQVTTTNGQINTSWIEGEINTSKNRLISSGSYASATVLENEGYLNENIDESSPTYGATYTGAGINAYASKKINGEWQWSTFATGQGVIADSIKVGTIAAERFVIGANTQYETGYNPARIKAELQEQIDSIEGGINQAVIDGIIDEAEAKAIATYINSLNTEMSKISAQFNEVYGHNDLTEQAKDALLSAKIDYDLYQYELVQTISDVIQDGKVTPEEKLEVDFKFSDYRHVLTILSTRFEEANNAITTAKANAAQSAAEAVAVAQAQLARTQAEAYADGVVTAEEQARISQASANLNAAKADATSKANAAESAAKNASVLKGTKYKSVYIDTNGFHIDNAVGEVVRMGEYAAGKFGVISYHADGSTTSLSPTGLLRTVSGVEKPYHYLMAAGSSETGNQGNYFDGGGSAYASGISNGGGIPNKTITLPADFRGKDFTVSVSTKSDSSYAMAQKDGDSFYVPYASLGVNLEVVSINKASGTFTVKGYGSYMTVNPSNYEVAMKYYAVQFTWIAVV